MSLDSLIRTCAATGPMSPQTDEVEALRQKKCPPVASLGFWAQSEVPLSVGACSLNPGAKTANLPQLASGLPLATVALPTTPLEEELKVRDRLAMAKEMAEVGDDIRWDVIIEEAARMSCGLKTDVHTRKLKEEPLPDDDENRSTSASGSGGGEVDETEQEEEGSSNDETEDSGKYDAPIVRDAKLPPWRRSRAATADSTGSDRKLEQQAAAPPPWRRGAATKSNDQDVSARVYSITTMLQCFMLMNQSSAEPSPAEAPRQEAKEKLASIPPPPPGYAPRSSPAAPAAARDAPWRRRPRAAPETTAVGSEDSSDL